MKLRYIAWDMARAAKSNDDDVIRSLETIATEVLNVTGLLSSGSRAMDVPPTLQRGVVRTNCVDCLDRTNAAQFMVAKEAFARQVGSHARQPGGCRRPPCCGPRSCGVWTRERGETMWHAAVRVGHHRHAIAAVRLGRRDGPFANVPGPRRHDRTAIRRVRNAGRAWMGPRRPWLTRTRARTFVCDCH